MHRGDASRGGDAIAPAARRRAMRYENGLAEVVAVPLP